MAQGPLATGCPHIHRALLTLTHLRMKLNTYHTNIDLIALLEEALVDATQKVDSERALRVLRKLPSGYHIVVTAYKKGKLFFACLALTEFGSEHAAEVGRIFDLPDRSEATVRNCFFKALVAIAHSLATSQRFAQAEAYFLLSTIQSPYSYERGQVLIRTIVDVVTAVTIAERPLRTMFAEYNEDANMADPLPDQVNGILGDKIGCYGLLGRLAIAFEAAGYELAAEELFIKTLIRGSWPSWRGFGDFAARRPDIILSVKTREQFGHLELDMPRSAHLHILVEKAVTALRAS